MTPICSQEDMIRRASRLPLAKALELAKDIRAGHLDSVIAEIERRVPEPVALDGSATH